MARRYPPHQLRRVEVLDGIWDFAFLGPVEPDTVDPAALAFDDRLPVPGCFDTAPRYAGARGIGAYRTRFTTHARGRVRLAFGAVQHWCRVVVDGVARADHAGGFVPFPVDLVDLEPGEHELVVLVENRDVPERCPTHRDYYDWYHFGGIARSVELHHLPPLWIESVGITTHLDPDRAEVQVRWAADAEPGATALAVACDGAAVHTDEVRLEGTRGTFTFEVALDGRARWAPASPALHHLDVRLGADDRRERFGIRTVAVDGRRILVNGEPVRLVGCSRHEFHPDHGSALPDAVVVNDVQVLQELGATFVRGGHYPQDPRFLDLCDETGLLVWCEATGWQNHVGQLTDEHFLAVTRHTIDTMVETSRNHPSILCWGLLNEGTSQDEACRPAYEELIGRIRAADPSRPVTYASNHVQDDVCLDLVDIVSINLYAGWYYAELPDIPTEITKMLDAADARSAAPKPVIFSEFGGEGIPGLRDRHRDRWSEDHQRDLLAAYLDTLLVEPRVAGALIWVFSDFRVSPAMPRMLGRAGAYNHKGVVDAYRRPKLAFETVQARYRG